MVRCHTAFWHCVLILLAWLGLLKLIPTPEFFPGAKATLYISEILDQLACSIWPHRCLTPIGTCARKLVLKADALRRSLPILHPHFSTLLLHFSLLKLQFFLHHFHQTTNNHRSGMIKTPRDPKFCLISKIFNSRLTPVISCLLTVNTMLPTC